MKLQLSEQQLVQQVRYFGYYQLVGGGLVLGDVLYALGSTKQLTGLLSLLFVGCLGLAGFVLYCGYLVRKQPARGLQLSRISLLLQVFGFAAGGSAFHFFAGPFLALKLTFATEFEVSFQAALTDFYLYKGTADTLQLSVNVVAILLFLRTTQWLNEWHYRYPSTGQLP